MSFRIEYSDTPDYLHVMVTGDNTRENVEAYLKDVLEYCRRKSLEYVLIEERLDGDRLGLMDVFAIASEGSLQALGCFEAVAYVEPRMGDFGEFAETVAISRGMPVAVFDSVEHAAEWLRARRAESSGKYIFIKDDGQQR